MIRDYFAIDYQVHSYCSHDGQATIREQCARAVELGLEEIGFSEHKDFDPKDPAVGYFDYDRYADEIAEAREEFSGALAVRMGVEVDYQKWFESEIADFLGSHAFDFVIGSVHYVDSVMLMTPEYVEGRTKEEAYRGYYQAVFESVASGLIDIVGHLEYANRRGVPLFGAFDPTSYRFQVEELVDAMIARNVALEINTAGLRQGTGNTYPCEAHVALYAERGGKLLTIGSDAHRPEDLADQYTLAAEMALRHGLREITVWSGRSPTSRALRATPAPSGGGRP
jgi:histidinol-phosphatase (PHP family)